VSCPVVHCRGWGPLCHATLPRCWLLCALPPGGGSQLIEHPVDGAAAPSKASETAGLLGEPFGG
jgi:hypothetical protein